MLIKHNSATSKRELLHAIFIPILIGLMMILSFIMEKGMDWNFHTSALFPRRLHSLWGIFTIVFIHADLEHLLNNLLSFLILGTFLFHFYRQIAWPVLWISYLLSGLLLWIIGRESWHIGASGLIYSIAFFLFLSGLIRKYAPLMAISFVVVLLYGGMVWHLFPWQIADPVSWEGHLSGGIVGSVLSLLYRNKGPQKPEVVWEEEEVEISD